MNSDGKNSGRCCSGGRAALGIMLVAAAWISLSYFVRPARQTAGPSERTRSELEFREERWLDHGRPFTGMLADHYAGGELKSRCAISNGLPEGLSEGWYTNGQKQIEERFVAGISDGQRLKWYPSGAKLSEVTIVKGELHGTFLRWHENGQLAERIELSHGKPNGLSLAYHPSGKLKAQARLAAGRILERQSWDDGAAAE